MMVPIPWRGLVAGGTAPGTSLAQGPRGQQGPAEPVGSLCSGRRPVNTKGNCICTNIVTTCMELGDTGETGKIIQLTESLLCLQVFYKNTETVWDSYTS